MTAFNAVGRLSTLFLFFILYTNNIVHSNAQPTMAPTMNDQSTIAPTMNAQSTMAPTMNDDSTTAPTLNAQSTMAPTMNAQSTIAPTTNTKTTMAPTMNAQSTTAPTTNAKTTMAPTTNAKTTIAPTMNTGPQDYTVTQDMDGLILLTVSRTSQFKQAIQAAVASILGLDKSAVSVYSTNASRRRLMSVSEGSQTRNLHGGLAGVSAVYVVTMTGTTATALAATMSGATSTISNTLTTYGFLGTTIGEATVVLGSPSLTSPTGSKSSASSGTRSHLAVMICALAVVVMQSVLL